MEISLIKPSEYREELRTLLNEVFRESYTPEQFAWKFEQNPVGESIAWAVLEQGPDPRSKRILGTLLAFPREFIHDGRVVTTLQVADAAVRPELQGKGVFGAILKDVDAFIRSRGFPFLIAYTNDLSAPAFRRLPSCRELHVSRTFFRPIGAANIAERLFPRRTSLQSTFAMAASPLIRITNAFARPEYTLEPVQDFTPECDQWSFENAAFHAYFPHRSTRFLRWKGLAVPSQVRPGLRSWWFTKGGRKIGYCILYREEKRSLLKIIDCIVCDPKAHLPGAFRTIRAHAAQIGADAVTTNVAGELYSAAVRRAGFFPANRIRCTLLVGDLPPSADTADESFWFNSPIDRDNFAY